MNETDVAQAVQSGELASPHRFENIWYFRMRVTGTGDAYRPKHEEHVYRPPEVYLNDEFLARCMGLPVILEHPKKETLDSSEFSDRVVGMIVTAWVQGDEVWGVAKIYDQPTAEYMRDHQLSTSPAVVFRYKDETRKVDTPDGKHLLIEGDPSQVDHLAICEEGVWDKGGPPSGVDISGVAAARSDSMPDEDKKLEEKVEDKRDDRARDDDAKRVDEKLDKMLAGIDAISSRQDALEARFGKKKDDSRKKRDDAKRDDGEAEAENERRQAEDLRKLAEEEEEEASEEAAEDDSKRDDDDEEEEEGELSSEHLARHNGESDSAYSKRMDALSKKRDDAKRYAKRDDEEVEEHADRCDAACRRMDKRRDDSKRDDRKKRDDKKRMDRKRDDDTYDDKRRDDDESEEEEEQMAKADSARVSQLERKIERLERRTVDSTDDEQASFADAQFRADEAYGSIGKRAPQPLAGENLMGYRIRLLRGLQSLSRTWKDSDFLRLARADTVAFGNAEQQVYADAVAAGNEPSSVALGTLREIRKRRPGGGEIIEFAGHPLSWMAQHMAPGAGLSRFGLRKS